MLLVILFCISLVDDNADVVDDAVDDVVVWPIIK
jgi:hypothetical protein